MEAKGDWRAAAATFLNEKYRFVNHRVGKIRLVPRLTGKRLT
jgi:hypothetical protein